MGLHLLPSRLQSSDREVTDIALVKALAPDKPIYRELVFGVDDVKTASVHLY